MEQNRKPVYSVGRNLTFLLRLAWQEAKSVPFYCLALAAATAGVTVAQLLIAPVVLQRVDRKSVV